MKTLKLMRQPDIIQVEAGGQTVLYTAADEGIHCLNPTARVIWDLCDGQHTLEDMEAALRASFAISTAADVRSDIQRALDTLADKGLLQ